MKKFEMTKKLSSLLLAICILLQTAFAVPLVVLANEGIISSSSSDEKKKNEASADEDLIEHAYTPFASIKEYQYSEKADEVDESSLMLKVSANAPDMSPIPEELAALGVSVVRTMVDVTTPEAMAELGVSTPYRWLMVGLSDKKATEVALSFADVPYVLDAEYNYVRQSSALPAEETNPLMKNQWHLQSSSLQGAWGYIDSANLAQSLSQVVVAVIDTGVDYTHPNLVNSMWVNVNEIPGDYIDNDGNGYVDDIYGISTLGSIFDANGDPMDEMGHGTHVAGIIAASADAMGAVGVAYGAKIMAIKAGDSSGVFNDSDIIEAINYAITMGADVINMSFGSYARSAAIEDALALAYTSAVLVAAAGNDGLDIVRDGMPAYPASYNFVIGVMATDQNGGVAGFSNTDFVLRRNSLEYEICAPGASILSTLPGNRYASWSGTSMACPYVSAVAALLRAKYNDKSVYSTRYIMGQIVGTAIGSDSAFPMIDPYAALTEIPEPDVSYYDYYIFDDPAYSEKNNGDGIIDAGETIGLGVLIRNHWGQARKTKVTLIAAANSTDATLCPHVSWITDTVEYGDVGTFNTASNGFSYDTDGVITGISSPFLFTVSESTPNDYNSPFSLVVECESYTESDEVKTYRFDTETFTVRVRKGYELPRLIDSDMTLTADQYYIISGSTLIESGVTVTVEPGTQIQFWGDYSKELYAGTDVAELLVDGELIIKGSATNPVDLFPSGSMSEMMVNIKTRLASGRIYMEYCNVANPVIAATTVDHCYFTQMVFDCMCALHKDMDGNWYTSFVTPSVTASTISSSIFYELGYRYMYYDYRLSVGGKLVGNLFDSCGLNFSADDWSVTSFTDNVFLKNYRLVESQYDDRSYLTSEFNISTPYTGSNSLAPLYPVKNPETGSTYFVLHTSSIVLAEDFAKRLGGSVVKIDDEAEKEFLLEYAKRYYAYNEELTDYNWSPSLNYLYIGFYGNENGISYIGEGETAEWLNIPENFFSIPMIGTSYHKPNNDTVSRNAYISSFFSGDSYFIESYLSTNPSNTQYSDRGVIIEIPGEITPLSISFECDAISIPSNTVNYSVLTSVYPMTDHYTLSFSSADESVVSVGADGRLSAVGLGTTTVTVKVDGTELADTLVVVVTQYYPPESISDSDTTVLLTSKSESVKLSPIVAPAEASALIEFVSSDTSVVTVGYDGTLTAISSGEATVTAKIVGTELSIDYKVKVKIVPTTVEVIEDYLILSLGDDERKSLAYRYAPDYATVGTVVEYLSSDEEIVTVSATGELTPIAVGNATVWISFPEIDRALQAKIVVVDDASSLKIVKGDRISNDTSESALYAEDGTTYLLLGDKVFGNNKLPQIFPFKTKGIAKLDSSRWAYVDAESNLRVYHVNSKEVGTLIAEGVSDVWAHSWRSSCFYYQKLDGTVWYYQNGETMQNSYFEQIVDALPFNEDFIFLDANGTLWYDETPSDNESLTLLSFSAKPIEIDHKFAFLTQNGCFDANGVFYHFVNSQNELSLQENDSFSAERLSQTLDVSWDRVVDVARCDTGTSYSLLLLDDGRVVYAGHYYPGDLNNLADLISIPAYGNVGYCFLDLDERIVSFGQNAMITENGSVLCYISTYGAVLGNGKTYNANQSLTRPVTPRLGLEDDGKNVTFESVSYTDGNGASRSESLADGIHLDGRVAPDSLLSLSLSKTATVAALSSIVLKDAFGTKVALTSSLDPRGNTLTITPAAPLKAGYEYVLTIPAAIVADEFNNTSSAFTFDFTVSGVAVYDVPVTGVEIKGADEITLSYGQRKSLSVTVLPENASMKKLIWHSSDEMVVMVDAAGNLVGGINGVATVTASTVDGGYSVSYTVTVFTKPDSVSLSSGYFLLEVGEESELSIVSTPIYAGLGTISYKSGNSEVATVDANGTITAVGIGSTLVSISSSATGKSYYALVDVVADASFAEIDRAMQITSRDRAFFIAEDGSVWYISGTSNGNESIYLPRKAPFSAKKVIYDGNWNNTYYITEDNKLYRVDSFMQSSDLIASDVVDAVAAANYIFYIKTDGSTYFYNNERETKCPILSGTSSLYYSDSVSAFLFLSQSGTVRYTTTSMLENGMTSSDFGTVDIEGGEKIVSLSYIYLIGENGNVYRLSSSNEILNASLIWQSADYEEIRDRVVKIVAASYDASESFIALLSDGSVYYLGSGHSRPIGLISCIDFPDGSATVSTVAEQLKGVEGVVDIAPGYLVLSDGRVLSYMTDSSSYYRYMLGNNNWEQKIYNAPTTAWFGVRGDVSDLALERIESVSHSTNEILSVNKLSEGLAIDSIFRVTYDRPLAFLEEGITLTGIDGTAIPITVTIDGNAIVITPNDLLDEGTLYTLSLPSGTAWDILRNTMVGFEMSFTTAGTLSFEIPVQGITDTVDRLTVSYGESKTLTPTVTPADATMQRISWSSSDERIVTVTENGVITGYENGTAIVTAKTLDGAYTYSYTVTVFTEPDSVSLSRGYFLFEIGESGKLEIFSSPSYAGLGTLTYASGDSSIATIDENGTITAVGLGSTLVSISSSTTAESYYALVDVVADSSFAEIKEVQYSPSNSRAFFIAKDNSVWYISSDAANGTDNAALPRKAPFKAKRVIYDPLWNNVLYISLDDKLYNAGSSMQSSGYLIAEDVTAAAASSHNLFYVKTDGSTYHYSFNTSKHTKCTVLSGTTEIYAYGTSSVFFFLSQSGTLRYTTSSLIENGLTSSDFKTLQIPNDEKIVSVSFESIIGENGGIYCLQSNGSDSYTVSSPFDLTPGYEEISDRIVKTVAANRSNNAFLALLSDGSVYYFGSAYNLPLGLTECIDLTGNTYGYVVRPVLGVEGVVDIGIGYFVLSDGKVLSYQINNYSIDHTMLGNNNLDGICYKEPVIAWFGASGSFTDLTLESALHVKGEASGEMNEDDLASGLDVNSHFILTFDRPLAGLADGITLLDMGGTLLPITVTVTNCSIVITPNAPLTEGRLYTLTISSGSVCDLFGNTCPDVELIFTTVGELHLEKPVQGITDTISRITLSYGETYTLTPTVTPADASLKRLTFTTSDPSVATVTKDGHVTGHQNGTATVTATTVDGAYSYSYTVTVYTPIESFKLSEEFVTLDLTGKRSVQLSATVEPSYLTASGLLRWSVADPTIATVSADGTITAQSGGVTAVYCYCEGVSAPAICIVSVMSDSNDSFITGAMQKYGNGYLFEAADCLWIVDSAHPIPEKLTFKRTVIKNEMPTSEAISVADMKQVLYTPVSPYSGDRSEYLILFLDGDGTLLFYLSHDRDDPYMVRSGVEKMIYAQNHILLLHKDGTLSQIRPDGIYMDHLSQTALSYQETTVDVIAGIDDIVYQSNSDTVYLRQINRGLVWSYNPNSDAPLSLVFSDEPIVDLSIGQGFFMLGESGTLYPLRTSTEEIKTKQNDLRSSGFYSLGIEIADIVGTERFYNTEYLILTTDGKLLYFGYSQTSLPFSEQYSDYVWTRSETNSNLFYIDTGKAVEAIGLGYILFTDGSIKTYGEYDYLGNAKYTEGDYASSLTSPYFTETEVDINALTLLKVELGSTEIDPSEIEAVDPADRITLTYSLPLVPTDLLLATTVSDSRGNYPSFEVVVDGRCISLVFAENLKGGETYTVTIYEGSVQDIFYNKGERVSFTVSINDTSLSVQSEESSPYPSTDYSPDWTQKQLTNAARSYYDEILLDYIVEHSENVGNAFLNAFANPDTTAWMNLVASQNVNSIGSLIGNFWGTTKTDLIDRIIYDVNDSFNYGELLYDPILQSACETAYPFVTSIVVKNSEGNVVSSVGMEEITVEVYFNRDMDRTVQPTVAYGSDYPFGDFLVSGDWKDARTWVGTTKISAVTGSGTQYFKVRGAVAEGDSWLVTGNDYERFAFTIATSGAKSMSMQANGGDGYVSLEWMQDDYETMAGYNVYRSVILDGSYTRLNSTLISQDVTAFIDDKVDPGVQYYYYFTVVGTDLKESEPSGIAMASAIDTTPPTVSHSVITTAPIGSSISIVANVYDNLRIASVKLYYRVKGQSSFSSVDMYCNANAESTYTATIPASVVTADGVEYYIEASDGRQSGFLGSAIAPHKVSTYRIYSITVMTVSGGRIAVSKTRAKAGDYITVSTTADSGYAYLAGSLRYTANGQTSEISHSGFTMPECDVVITAEFTERSIYANGDLNRDGLINSADAILLLRYDAGLETLDSEQRLLADVNSDGSITLQDASKILSIDAGL